MKTHREPGSIKPEDFVPEKTISVLIDMLSMAKRKAAAEVILLAARMGAMNAALKYRMLGEVVLYPNKNAVEPITDLRLAELVETREERAATIRAAIRDGAFAALSGSPVQAASIDFKRYLEAANLRRRLN